MNIRRKLLAALGVGALAAPLASFAQQQAKIRRVYTNDKHMIRAAPAFGIEALGI